MRPLRGAKAWTSSRLRHHGRGCLSALALLALGQSSLAQDKPVDCKTGEDQTTLNICSYQRFQADDLALNNTYRAMMSKLDKSEKAYAVAAQAAWIKFRDAECLALSGGPREQGGTIWPLLNNECMSRLTKARTQDLKQQVACPAGHLDCPAP